MANPTYRDLTKRFQEKRKQFRSDNLLPTEVSQSYSNNSGKSLLNPVRQETQNPAGTMGIAPSLPPIWMELLESIDADILKIQRQS